MSREYTEEEIRNKFLDYVWNLVEYWKKVDGKDWGERMEGLAFSILSTIDGSSISLPSFILAPDPHPDDKEYHIKKGENYYPENYELDVKCNINGGLHELFHSRKK